MRVQSISLHNVRSYDLARFELDPNVTLILGANGSGKTTLLEGVYLLLRGTTFRGRDRDVIASQKTAAEMHVELDNLTKRKAHLSILDTGKVAKKFAVGSSQSARLPAKDRLPVVLFEPDELRLLTSSPQRRRDFIDGIISRLSPTYATVLNRFARTLLQRNELLKQYEQMTPEDWQNHLFVWDVKLSELSSSIIKARKNFIIHANEHLSNIYSRLAGQDATVTAHYQGGVHAEDELLQQTLLHKLEMTRNLDRVKGFTSTGPHRDDIELHLNNQPAINTASRGEMRTIMLAFKLLEVELQEHHSGHKPLILLDDVFSELDTSREQQLMKALEQYQTIITATDLRDELKINATVITLQ